MDGQDDLTLVYWNRACFAGTNSPLFRAPKSIMPLFPRLIGAHQQWGVLTVPVSVQCSLCLSFQSLLLHVNDQRFLNAVIRFSGFQLIFETEFNILHDQFIWDSYLVCLMHFEECLSSFMTLLSPLFCFFLPVLRNLFLYQALLPGQIIVTAE
jgi:hypothetical protein